MMYQTRIDTRHLPPELQELVDTIITGVMALASRANSNSDSNSLGGTSSLYLFLAFLEDLLTKRSTFLITVASLCYSPAVLTL